MTYQQYRDKIDLLKHDLAMSDRARERKDEQIAAVVSTCQRYAHSGVNLETHRLAAKVLSLLGVEETA